MKVLFLVFVLTVGLCFVSVHGSSENQNEESVKQLVDEAIKEATAQYDEMMLQATLNGAQSKRQTREAQKSTKTTKAIGRISSIYRKAFKLLTSRNQVDRDSALKYLRQALPRQCQFPELECDRNTKYRTVDGTCNNLEKHYWGATQTRSRRLLPPAYEGGIEVPRGGYNGGDLPQSRTVSLAVHIGDGSSYEVDVTHMAAQFGQFLDHDISLTPSNSGEVSCCENATATDECWTIPVEPTDEHYSKYRVSCLDFVRSTENCFPLPDIDHREQLNAITAYIDGSVVYGSDETTFNNLRKGAVGGRLVVNEDHPGFLPWKSQVIEGSTPGEIIAGDIRANEMPGLTVMHSLFLREHNRLAEELGNLKRDWDDEKIFQETRRIIAANLQQITYGEFLPAILGHQAMKDYKLELPDVLTAYTKYNASVDPTIYNNFATAAYRFGHTLVNGLIQLFLDNAPVGSYNVRDNYLISEQILNNQNGVSGYDLILNGLIRQPSQKYDGEIHGDMTNHLFKRPGFIGSDLAARNIQRGRDHGIPSYNAFRVKCNLDSLNTWASTDRPAEISETSWAKLQAAGYKSPKDIDLYTGGLSEIPVPGALSGPTFVCLQGIQFQDLMEGDRFFFTHGDVSGSFSPEQLAELRRRTLGDIICENSEIKETVRNVFYVPSALNPMISCDDTSRRFNLALFTEETSVPTTPGTTGVTGDSGATANLAAFSTLFASLLFVLLPLAF